MEVSVSKSLFVMGMCCSGIFYGSLLPGGRDLNRPCVLQMKLSALEVAQFLMLTTTSVTTLLLACPQLQEGAAPSVADTAGNNLHSTPACCSAQQTAATALPEFCNAELHGRLCSQFDGLR